MKKRDVMAVGTLRAGGESYVLIRTENLDAAFPDGVSGFTVTKGGYDDKMRECHVTPFLLVTTPPWSIVYRKPVMIEVIDDSPDEMMEVDEQIPEPDINPNEWEQLLLNLNDEQENVE